MLMREYSPGHPAPASGVFSEVNIFGTPTGEVVHVEVGAPLPAAPIGFRWVIGAAAPDDTSVNHCVTNNDDEHDLGSSARATARHMP